MHDFITSSTPISTPFGGPGVSGFTPGTLLGIYGVDQIEFSSSSGAVQGTGKGETIAIVDGFSDPYITSELQVFDATFGLSAPPSFTVVNQNGGNNLPGKAVGNGLLEIALDVEWAHAAAPGANIVLLEANSMDNNDLLTAVDTARNLPGVVAVSMSWGGGEYSSELADDAHFKTPNGHVGIAFIASSGDDGGASGADWPAISPNVVGVGGTTLTAQSNGTYYESAWSGSGGGISAFESQPSFQKGTVTQSQTKRTAPDVAYDANPSTGVDVYMSGSGWSVVGGTSAGAPQWAGLLADIDQGRALAGLGSLDSGTQLLPALYALPTDFTQITQGSNAKYSASAGYNLVTGLGSPLALELAADLTATSNGGGTNITNTLGGSLTGQAGTKTSGVVATFTDSDPTATIGSFTATINWGDGSTSAGVVTYASGVFKVSGSETYHQYGTYQTTVVVSSSIDGTATINGQATISDAPIHAHGIGSTLGVGSGFSSVIAGFTDDNPYAAPSQFQVTIDWGDGSTSTGQVQYDVGGGFDVIGAHTYNQVGTFKATITILSGGGASAAATSTFTATVGSGSTSPGGSGGTGSVGGTTGSPSTGSSGFSSGGTAATPVSTPAPAAPPTVVGFGSSHKKAAKHHPVHSPAHKHTPATSMIHRKLPAVGAKHGGNT